MPPELDMVCNVLFQNIVQIILEHPVSLTLNHPVILAWRQVSGCGNRASGAGQVAQARDGPIFETFQDFSSGHMLVQAENVCACCLQAKSR